MAPFSDLLRARRRVGLMRPLPPLAVVLLVVPLLGMKGPPRARGETFSVPVPKGYSVTEDPRLTRDAPGGVVLLADEREGPGFFRGSIVVTRIAPGGADFDQKDVRLCAETARAMGAAVKAHVKAHGIVDTAAGPACQWKLQDEKTPTRGSTGTVMYETRANSWIVTCNYDQRDARATPACDRVLRGWKFDGD